MSDAYRCKICGLDYLGGEHHCVVEQLRELHEDGEDCAWNNVLARAADRLEQQTVNVQLWRDGYYELSKHIEQLTAEIDSIKQRETRAIESDMNTCATCKHLGKPIENLDDDIELRDPIYHECNWIKFQEDKYQLNEFDVIAGVLDGSGYWGALCVRHDFGCNQWEAK